MEWTDNAIILSVRKFGEEAGLVKLLTRHHGLYAGIVKGAGSKRLRGVYQPGNLVNARWKARLPEHMGTISAELLASNAALFLEDSLRLTALSTLCAMVEYSLPERQVEEEIFLAASSILEQLKHNNPLWQKEYVLFETALLTVLGFGLDLSECAATGSTETLVYVSPKSGRAVSQAAGLPYHDKLLPLPLFCRDLHADVTLLDIKNGLKLTGYFLEKYHFLPHHNTLPSIRGRLINYVISLK